MTINPCSGAVIPGGMAAMNTPTATAVERAICCPHGTCTSPHACYAEDRTRSQIVNIQEAAKAVAQLYRARWKAESFNVDQERWRTATSSDDVPLCLTPGIRKR